MTATTPENNDYSLTAELGEIERDDLNVYEVNLVHNRSEPCSDDECLIVAAPTREIAISEARCVSTENPAEIGPVYKNSDNRLFEHYDNIDRIKKLLA